MNRIVVAFALPADFVAELIDLAQGSAVEPMRWVVFGSQSDAMTELLERCQRFTDVLPVLVPETVAGTIDAAFEILAHEQLALQDCIWLQEGSAPGRVRALAQGWIDCRGENASAVLTELLTRYAAGPQLGSGGPRRA
jgi:hypothetical protein